MELWKNIDALELEHLSRTKVEPSFNPSEFFKKLGWAHAELSVALNLVDMIISGKTLAIQPVSGHPERSSRGSNFNDSIKANAIHAKSIFDKASSEISIDEDLGLIEAVLQLRTAGWPVYKVGLNWAVNFDFRFLQNQAQDPGCLAFVSFKDTSLAYDTIYSSKRLVFYDSENRPFCLSSDTTDPLWVLMLSSLDRALFKQLQSTKFTDYRYDLTEKPVSMDPIPEAIVTLYKNFLLNKR